MDISIVMSKKKAIIVSGYFNPLHKGHLEYFNNAKSLADLLIVIVNSDLQRSLKGSKEFQNESERMFIVSNIKAVDKAVISIDNIMHKLELFLYISVKVKLSFFCIFRKFQK